MRIGKTLRRGRLKSLRHKDIIEVEWVDTAGSPGWGEGVSEPVKCTTVGYYNQVKKSDTYGSYLSMFPNVDEGGKIADSIAIPEVNIVAIRCVSRGIE